MIIIIQSSNVQSSSSFVKISAQLHTKDLKLTQNIQVLETGDIFLLFLSLYMRNKSFTLHNPPFPISTIEMVLYITHALHVHGAFLQKLHLI